MRRTVVMMGQRLGIKNRHTMEQLVCRVVHMGPDQVGKKEVGIEFETPSPRFWRITFPPADWTPRSPEAKAPTKYVPGARPLVKKVDVPASGAEKTQTTKLPGPAQG